MLFPPGVKTSYFVYTQTWNMQPVTDTEVIHPSGKLQQKQMISSCNGSHKISNTISLVQTEKPKSDYIIFL